MDMSPTRIPQEGHDVDEFNPWLCTATALALFHALRKFGFPPGPGYHKPW